MATITGMPTDFDNLLTLHGTSITLRTSTPTLDAEGKTTAFSNSDATVNVIFMELGSNDSVYGGRDYEFIAAGRLAPVHRKAFFSSSATVSNGQFVIVTSGSEEYQIVAIRPIYDGGTLCYQTAFLRRTVG